MKWINAEQQVTVTIYDEEREEHRDKIMTVEEMLDTYTNEGCPTMYFVPERKKGKWIWVSSTYDRTPCEMRYMCSECHHETILHSNEASYPWEKFCPNCGSDNRKEGDNT